MTNLDWFYQLDFWTEHATCLEDLELIDEIINLCYTDTRVDFIVENYYNGQWQDLTEGERKYLENFFVLNMVEVCLEE